MSSPVVFTNAQIIIGGYDLAAEYNAIELAETATMLDANVFGDAAKRMKGGLKTFTVRGSGLYSSVEDPVLTTNLGLADVLLALFPTTVVDGTTKGYAYQCVEGLYNIGARVGSLLPFSFQTNPQGTALARAISLKDFRSTALTTTANGTAFQLGALVAGQTLYAGLHIFGAGTGTIDVTIQSDTASNFPSATTQVTFAQQAALNTTGVWATPITSAITDDWWRASWTIAGGAPSFTGIVWMAIQ